MDLLKKVLSFILILQLLVVLTILTKYSLKKVDTITNHFNLLKIDQESYQKDITLAKIIQNRDAIKKAVVPFNYKKYQQNREIALSWLLKDNSSVIVKNIEYKAKKFLGKPYVWGATGPKCFDCSGFTQKVYKMVGINLPRVSRNQAKVGKLVRFNELKKGDMVFFDTSKKRVGKVNHVGIYLEDGKFIHASSGKHQVVITSFNKKRFYKSRFLWGRRVIKNNI
jgi:cell wall-associated NlpC family hydrolase